MSARIRTNFSCLEVLDIGRMLLHNAIFKLNFYFIFIVFTQFPFFSAELKNLGRLNSPLFGGWSFYGYFVTIFRDVHLVKYPKFSCCGDLGQRPQAPRQNALVSSLSNTVNLYKIKYWYFSCILPDT